MKQYNSSANQITLVTVLRIESNGDTDSSSYVLWSCEFSSEHFCFLVTKKAKTSKRKCMEKCYGFEERREAIKSYLGAS